MGKMLRLASSAFVYACIATILAQGIGLAVLAATGVLTQEKMYDVLAVAYGIDLAELEAKHQAIAMAQSTEQPAFEDIVEARAMKRLDLELREQAVENGLDDLRNLQAQLVTERKRYDDLRKSFDKNLKQLAKDTKNAALLEVQQTLEAISPKQAKEQILIMLDDDDADAADSVVVIMKAMPLDKRKKLIAEFKTPEEVTKLAQILRQIRLGRPDGDIIKNTQDQLQKFSPKRS